MICMKIDNKMSKQEQEASRTKIRLHVDTLVNSY